MFSDRSRIGTRRLKSYGARWVALFIMALLAGSLSGCASGPGNADVRFSEPGLLAANGSGVFDGLRETLPAGAGLLYVLGPTFNTGTHVQTEVRVGYRLLGTTWSENYVVGILEPGTYTVFSRVVEPADGPVAALEVAVESGQAGFILQSLDPVRKSLVLEPTDPRNASVQLKRRYLSMENTMYDFLERLAVGTGVEKTWEAVFRAEARDTAAVAAAGDVEKTLLWMVSVAANGRNIEPFANRVLQETLLEISNASADEALGITDEPFTERVRAGLDALEAYFSKVPSQEGTAAEGELSVELLRTVLTARAVRVEQAGIRRLMEHRDRSDGDLIYECAERRDRYLLTFLSSLEKTVRLASVEGIPSATRFRVLECIDKINTSMMSGSLKNAHVHQEIRRLGESDPDPLVRSRALRLSESILGHR